jgi:hypothetical protein
MQVEERSTQMGKLSFWKEFIQAISWSSWASNRKLYAKPKGFWQEFLHALSFSKGRVIWDVELTKNVVKTQESRDQIIEELVITYSPEPTRITPLHKRVNATSESSVVLEKAVVLC